MDRWMMFLFLFVFLMGNLNLEIRQMTGVLLEYGVLFLLFV